MYIQLDEPALICTVRASWSAWAAHMQCMNLTRNCSPAYAFCFCSTTCKSRPTLCRCQMLQTLTWDPGSHWMPTRVALDVNAPFHNDRNLLASPALGLCYNSNPWSCTRTPFLQSLAFTIFPLDRLFVSWDVTFGFLNHMPESDSRWSCSCHSASSSSPFKFGLTPHKSQVIKLCESVQHKT